MVTTINTKPEFEDAVKDSSKLVVVDFFATWCGPCRVIAPKIVQMSNHHEDVSFYKVDVDELNDIAAEHSIRAMPTFLFFKGGEKVGEVVGANPKAIEAAIEKYNV
jgi:thioredoxin 1